jgi:glutamate carboxypeptidase
MYTTSLIPELRKTISDLYPEALQLLKQLVEIGSYSMDPDGVNQTGDVLETEFEKLGFVSGRVQSTVPGCGKHLMLNKPGTGHTALLLVGHLDTVYSNEELEKNKFRWREDGHRIFGPGTVDVKGGNVMIWLLLKALMVADPEFYHSVHWQVHFDAAEELLGVDFAEASIRSLHPRTKAALVFEFGPTEGREWKILTGRKGRAQLEIQVVGKAAHAGHPELGANAIRQLAELIPQIEDLTDIARGLTANVGMIKGGDACNVVPDFAEASVEVRATSNEVLDEAVEELLAMDGKGTVQAAEGGFTCKIHVNLLEKTDAWNPNNPESQQLLSLWKVAGSKLDLEIDHYERGGLSDGNYLAAQGLPTLDGLGPDGGNLHNSRNDPTAGVEPEYIRIDTFIEKTLLNAIAIRMLV